jgi:hypothetical protein
LKFLFSFFHSILPQCISLLPSLFGHREACFDFVQYVVSSAAQFMMLSDHPDYFMVAGNGQYLKYWTQSIAVLGKVRPNFLDFRNVAPSKEDALCRAMKS